MSIFAKHIQTTLPIPGTSFTVTLKKLSGRDLEVAQSEHLRGEIAGINPRGWAQRYREAIGRGKTRTAWNRFSI